MDVGLDGADVVVTLLSLRHELCHVRQMLDWGGLAYMCRHLWAGVKTHVLSY